MSQLILDGLIGKTFQFDCLYRFRFQVLAMPCNMEEIYFVNDDNFRLIAYLASHSQ